MKKEECPVRGQRCTNCKGKNHFQPQCKRVNVLELEHSDSCVSDDSWLNTIENPKEKKNISALMMVNDCEISFQLDS